MPRIGLGAKPLTAKKLPDVRNRRWPAGEGQGLTVHGRLVTGRGRRGQYDLPRRGGPAGRLPNCLYRGWGSVNATRRDIPPPP